MQPWFERRPHQGPSSGEGKMPHSESTNRKRSDKIAWSCQVNLPTFRAWTSWKLQLLMVLTVQQAWRYLSILPVCFVHRELHKGSLCCGYLEILVPIRNLCLDRKDEIETQFRPTPRNSGDVGVISDLGMPSGGRNLSDPPLHLRNRYQIRE